MAHKEAAIWSLDFNNAGTRLVSGAADNTVKIWNPKTRKIIETLRGHKSWVFSVRFHPNGSYLASASEDCSVRIWDSDGNKVAKLVHAAPVQGIGFSPNGEILASACGDRKIHLWNLQRLPQIKRQKGTLLSSSFSHDSKRLATSSSDGTVFIWDVDKWNENSKPLKTFHAHKTWVKQVVFSPTSSYHLATASADGTACLWDEEGNCIHILKGHDKPVWSTNFSPDGNLLVTGSADTTIRLWDLQGNELVQFRTNKRPVWSVCFSTDGKLVASGADDGSVCLWDLQGNLVDRLTTNKGTILSVSFSSNGEFLAASSSTGELSIWSLKNRTIKVCTHNPPIPIWCACFSPDSQYLASGSLDRNAYLWDVQSDSKEPIRSLSGHDGPVRSVIFSSNGKSLVTTSSDGTVRMWPTTREAYEILLERGHDWLRQEQISGKERNTGAAAPA